MLLQKLSCGQQVALLGPESTGGPAWLWLGIVSVTARGRLWPLEDKRKKLNPQIPSTFYLVIQHNSHKGASHSYFILTAFGYRALISKQGHFYFFLNTHGVHKHLAPRDLNTCVWTQGLQPKNAWHWQNTESGRVIIWVIITIAVSLCDTGQQWLTTRLGTEKSPCQKEN